MKKELMINILLSDRYTRKEAEKAINTYGFMIYDDLKEAAADYDMTVNEISQVDQIGLRAVTYNGKTYIVCNPM